ncbi:MAG: ChaN family lipoprotein [Polaromonas sp.]
MTKLFSALILCAVLSSCASRPEAPVLRPLTAQAQAVTTTRLDALLPMDVLLLGEQHDAAEHQLIHQQVIALLAQRGLLAALALEMADAGVTTARQHPSSTEQEVKNALKWNDKSWPWAAYGPAVMTAVRAGVLVVGANLPRELMRPKMADITLDGQLPGPALKAQQQLIRTGHCNLLPESQITPMTRIQMARDISMAETLKDVALPGKVVVLLAGSAHADRLLGVPQHLPASLKVKAVRLRAGDAAAVDKADAFDAVWATPALPEKDYCAAFKAQMGK